MAGLYFPHDYTAAKDSKIIALRMAFGWEGYGVFWALIEMLASDSSHTLPTDFNSLAWELRFDAGKLKKLICDFGLFTLTEDGSGFYSERMSQQLQEVDELREKRRRAAKTRWDNEKTNADETDCKSNASACETKCKCNPKNENNASAMQVHVKSYANKINKSKENNINHSADADININSPRARNIEVAAAAERKVNIPPYESYSGEVDTYSPEVKALCDEVAAKFNTFALPVHLSLLQKLILALHRPGVDAIQMVRDGLKKYDSAMAIQSKKVKFEITTFLKPEMFLRLYNGDYDTVYANVQTQRSFAPLPTSKRPIGNPKTDDCPF